MKKEHLLFLIIPASQLLMLAGVLSGRHSLDFWGYGGNLQVSKGYVKEYSIRIWVYCTKEPGKEV